VLDGPWVDPEGNERSKAFDRKAEAQNHIGAVTSARPHPVRRSLTKLLQSPALFGGAFRCARLDYHRLAPHIIKRRQNLISAGLSENGLCVRNPGVKVTVSLDLAGCVADQHADHGVVGKRGH
jgi:hypothetical protein